MIICSPEQFNILPKDLDILDNNSTIGPGNQIADLIEQMTNVPGPDDDDGLGRNLY